jgi:hypothetical protein
LSRGSDQAGAIANELVRAYTLRAEDRARDREDIAALLDGAQTITFRCDWAAVALPPGCNSAELLIIWSHFAHLFACPMA